jgi:hypothetical protein
MADFTYWTLPMPVVGRPGAKITVEAIFKQSFGGSPAGAERFFAAYYGYSEMAARDFDFWNPNSGQPDRWTFDGVDYGSGFNNQIFFDAGYEKRATLTLGNTIGPVSYLTVPTAGAKGNWSSYIEYSVMTIDASLMMKGAGTKAPKAADIVAQAYRFADKYGTPVNSNDCHYIAAAVAGSAGATFTAGGNTQNVVDPSQNIEHGFWRIAYRGSDDKPTGDWQKLVKAGDIVRMGWKDGGFHTVTVLAVSKDKKTIKVYDNTNAGGTIGIHEANFDGRTKPGSITIYRLTTDNLYLEKGSERAEAIPGTIFNDKIYGGAGNDVIAGGKGADKLYGGAGKDVFVFAKLSDSTVASRDTVCDFAAGDRFDLHAIDASTAKSGNQAFTFLGTEAFHGKAGELRYNKKASDTYVYADTNGDKTADFSLHLDDARTLAKDDFVL